MQSDGAGAAARADAVVLIVDDDPARRYVHTRLLSQAGYRVVQASNGQDALALAAKAKAVLLDVHLPDVDGLEVCRRLRSAEETSWLAIIHLSAVFVQDRHAELGRASGADAYLIDPVPPHVLVQVIDSEIAGRALR